MKLAVIGSRSFDDYPRLKNKLDKIIKEHKIIEIISGGAAGADKLAEKYASENKIEILIFYPDYQKYGRGAPLIRNTTIIENCDVVVAFWDGKSTGTANALKKAEKLQKEIYKEIF